MTIIENDHKLIVNYIQRGNGIQDKPTLFIHYTYTESVLIYEICKQSKTDGPFSSIMRKMMQMM